MGGIQQTVSEGLRYLANKVDEGLYGEGDAAFEDDEHRVAFMEDLQDEVIGKMD